jgi:hypothetical protein
MQASNPTFSRLSDNDREFHTHTALHSNYARPNYNQHTQRKVVGTLSDSQKFTQCRPHHQEALNQAR